ncbi:MAG: hypothetical protein U0790_28085 [Isosphaeraceae bacterium]
MEARERVSAPPEDYYYAKQAGVMFDPIRLSHDDIVRRATEVRTRVDPQVVAQAFLASLTSRRLEVRSALGSYAVLRDLPDHEHHNRRLACPVCGEYDAPQEDEDLNVLNFERFKWGGVRHDQPVYATFDLEWFLDLDPPTPTDADIATFLSVVRAIESVPPDTTAPRLEKALGGLFPSNKAERDVLVGILGLLGVLVDPDHRGYGVVSSYQTHAIFRRITSWTSHTRFAGGGDATASIVRLCVAGSRHWGFESETHGAGS